MILITGDLIEKWVSISVNNPAFGSFSHRFDDIIGMPDELLVMTTLANDHQLTIQAAVSDLEGNSAGMRWTDQVLREFSGLKVAIIRHYCDDRIIGHASLSWLRSRLFEIDVHEDSEGVEICSARGIQSLASVDEDKAAMILNAFSRLKGEVLPVNGTVVTNSLIGEAIDATCAVLMWHHRLLDETGFKDDYDKELGYQLWLNAKAVELELNKYSGDVLLLQTAIAALRERASILLSIEPNDDAEAGEIVAFTLYGPDLNDFEKILSDRSAQIKRMTNGFKIFCAFFESSESIQMKDAVLERMMLSLKSMTPDSGELDFVLTDSTAVEQFLLARRRVVELLVNEIALVAVYLKADEDSSACYVLRCLQAMSLQLDDNCIRRLAKQSFLDILVTLLNSSDHKIRNSVVCMVDVIISKLLQSGTAESTQILDSITSILISKLRQATSLCKVPELELDGITNCEVILSKPVTISSLEDCYILKANTIGSFSFAFWLWLPGSSTNGSILVLEGELNSQRSLLSFGIRDGVYFFMLGSAKINSAIKFAAELWQRVAFTVDEVTGTVSLMVNEHTWSSSLAVIKSAVYSRLYIGHSETVLSLGKFVNCCITELVLRTGPNSSIVLPEPLPVDPPSQAFIINRFERCRLRLSCEEGDLRDLSFGIAPLKCVGQDSKCVFGQSYGTVGVHYSHELASFVLRSSEAESEVVNQNFPYVGEGFSMELDIRSCGEIILTAQKKGQPEMYILKHQSPQLSLRGMLIGIISEDLTSIRFEATDDMDRVLTWDMGIARYGYPAAFSPECPISPADVIAALGCLSKLPFDKMSREQKFAARAALLTLRSDSSSVLVRLSAARYVAHVEAEAWSE